MEEKRASASAREERDMGRARKGNAMLTRANEEHVKEFEGSSEMMMMMMKAATVLNVVLVSRDYPMIAPRCIGLSLYLAPLRFALAASVLSWCAPSRQRLSNVCLHLFISDMSMSVDIYYYSIY